MSNTEEHDLKMFAAAALQGLLAGLGTLRHRTPAETAAEAWAYAKAMVSAAPEPTADMKRPTVFDYSKGYPE